MNQFLLLSISTGIFRRMQQKRIMCDPHLPGGNLITWRAWGTETGPFGRECSTKCRVLSLTRMSERGPVRTAPVECDRCPS